MKYIRHDVWDVWNNGYTITICTNGFIKRNGECVMGKGLALDAKKRWPNLPKQLGDEIKLKGNKVFLFRDKRLITFPTKHNWWEQSDLELIRKSCQQLRGMLDFLIPDVFSPQRNLVFLPIPGIGNGQLDKEMVIPILEEELEGCDKICILEKP